MVDAHLTSEMSKWIRFAKERAYLTRSAIVKIIHGVPITVYKTSQGLKVM